MRKIFFFVFIAALGATTVQAQKKALGKKHLDWGLKAGVNLSTFNMDGSSTNDVSWRAGFAAGAFFRIHVAKSFAVQPEFLFSSMGAKIDNGITEKTTQRVNYFSIPVLAKYGFAKYFAVVAGPQIDFLLQGRDINGAASESTTNGLRDHSFNATAGIEFWPSHSIGASARYIHGFTNIAESGGPEVKNQGVQITLAVKL